MTTEQPRVNAWSDDVALVARILGGDEDAFAALVDALHRPLSRIAEAQIGRGATAEDLVQETWVSVVAHLADFQGRSSLRTWIATILVNGAKTRRERERRFVSLEDDPGGEEGEPAGRFSARGFWATPPADGPEAIALRKESRELIAAALTALPATQRAVVTLRDIEEWTSDEVCNVLELSESNQRVLLHRGRQRLRAALEASTAAESARGERVRRP